MRFLPALLLLAATPAFAAQIHVAVTGDDSGDGSSARPLKTISAAAQKAQPGDTVTVHAGTYREWVKPPRGGTSDKARITYEAAKGEQVVITGSESPKGWKQISGGVWELTLPNAFFKEGNPFDEQIYGSWYHGNGRPVHTGSVYLDGKALPEAFDATAPGKPGAQPLWYAKADGNGGPVLMNLEWFRPVGGQPMNSMQASIENGDQAICQQIHTRWPYGYTKDGAVIHLDGIDFGAGTDTVELYAGTLAKGGTVEFRLGKTDGELLGSAEVTNTGDWERYAVFKAVLSRKLSGKQNIRAVLRAPAVKPDGVTVITAKFPEGVDPNSGRVEIASRPAVFFPATVGKDYITVRGFTLENAASNWASPSAFQPGLIGPRWSKGWIIEDNEIRNSRCSGVSLGRPTFGHSHHYQKLQVKVYPEPNAGQTEAQLVDYFENASWTKNEAGFHIVRNNRIHDCGQTGIVGCSGGSFSVIEGNDIHDIHLGQPFTGEETAGIKQHFAVDLVMRNNRIHRTNLGVWIDWGSQNARITGNLFHDNASELFIEVNHGPILLANNLFLSNKPVIVDSQGVALAHNLLSGGFAGGKDGCGGGRHSYFYKPHDTVSAGKPLNIGGDWRWYNNLLSAGTNPNGRGDGQLPVTTSGNVFFGNAPDTNRWLFNILSFKPQAGPAVLAVKNDGKSGTSVEANAVGGEHVAGIRAGDHLRFDAIDFGSGSRSVEIRASADSGYGGRVEIRAGKPDGELLGACDIPATGGWQKTGTFKADLKPVSGKKKVFLVFTAQRVVQDTTPKSDDSPLNLPGAPAPKLVHKDDGEYLVFNTDEAWRTARRRKLVTTELLGKAVIPKQNFENSDGSPLRVDTDYFGKKRDASNPFPGPFETPVTGEVKVWPK